MAHILFVDDNSLIRDVICTALENRHHRVSAATNGVEGLRILSEHEDIALVISDLHMPKMNGVELAAAIRERNIAVPLIGLTAGSTADAQAMVAAGAHLVMTKPVTLNSFYAVLDRMLPER